MSGFDEYYEAREVVEGILRRDLVGPVREEEALSESPISYYVAGKLYPQGMDDDSELEEQGSEADDLEGSYDSPMVLSSQRRQASMGLTFVLGGESPAIDIEVEFAKYRPLSEDEASAKGLDEKFLPSTTAVRTATYMQRTPYRKTLAWKPADGHARVDLGDGALVDVRPRQAKGADTLHMAVSLINTSKAAEERLENAARAMFQVKLTVRLAGDVCFFVPASSTERIASDPELAELEMLYRDSRPFAYGHGCSADWDRSSSDPSWVSTTILPTYEVLQMKPRELSDPGRFSMKRLAECPAEQLTGDLSSFIDEYEAWIVEQKGNLKALPAGYRDIGERNVGNCEECARRMRRAVDELGKGGNPLRAFRLANKAMLLQRINTLKAKGVHVDERDVRWYPFQLGFLLLQVRSLAYPDEAERLIADLLWFPTGGGKTEAYLGVAAYAIFLRRLANPADSGVMVIMRYTLRLLTLQQFERATALVAACEYLRRKEGLGGEQITIGMYVGKDLTPNKLDKAASAIKDAQEGKVLGGGKADPFQVRRCPWCGSPLHPEDYKVDKDSLRMHSFCPNAECEFHDGIPAYVVDEDLYAHLPTFVVATVDKFAQVPLQEKTASMLGVGGNCSTPSLIIQDELHLITGPLGTMVGAYETAIGALCNAKDIPAKVLTSTATAKSSDRQLMSLYGRKSFQFPPQCLDLRDSFFAVEASPQEKPGRLYLGIMGADAAITTVAARTTAALLFATRYLEVAGFSDDVVDSYWTIVEYFNTLRELGGSLTTLHDTVQNIFAFLASTKFKDAYPGVDPDKRYGHVLELTSRRSSAEITRAFQDMERKHSRDDGGDSFDFVMATNMLSVGVDVGRLNVMAVYGQPKMSSEYIQATSRVGRATPGLVVSLLNPKRSRDRSHYEQFVGFHQALYKHVESSTLTPFSDRARDRSLHTVFVTLCRYMLPDMAPNEAADKFRAAMPGVADIKDEIVRYVQRVEPEEADAAAAELDEIAEEWESRTGGGLTYYTMYHPEKSLFKSDLEDDRFRVMNSMRSVEPSANLFEDRG